MKTILTVRKRYSLNLQVIDKIVIPNMRPFDAINMIAKKIIAREVNGVGYYFYETTKGIIFVVGITWYQLRVVMIDLSNKISTICL